jgi:hypothetical protein
LGQGVGGGSGKSDRRSKLLVGGAGCFITEMGEVNCSWRVLGHAPDEHLHFHVKKNNITFYSLGSKISVTNLIVNINFVIRLVPDY